MKRSRSVARRENAAGARQAIIYARVSDARQEEGWSHDAQLQRLREYASRNGLEVVREFVSSESAKAAGRKVFAECIKELERKGGPRVLLVEKADRATRNLADLLVLEELRQGGVDVRTTGAPAHHAPSTPAQSCRCCHWPASAHPMRTTHC